MKFDSRWTLTSGGRFARSGVLALLLVGIVALTWPFAGPALGNNPKAPLAYVTERDSNSVAVIDTTTNEIVAAVGVGDGASGMVVNPKGKRGYVANHGTFDEFGNVTSLSNTVSVVQILTATPDDDRGQRPPRQVTAVEVGNGPLGVALSPNGRWVYVTNFGTDNPDIGMPGNTVSVIKTASNRVVDTIEVGTMPAGVTFSPDGSHAYVINRGDDTVSAIDTASATVVATIPVGNKPANVAVTPDGKRAYVTNFGLPPDPDLFPGTTVSVIDTDPASPTHHTVIDTINLFVGEAPGFGPLGVAITPAGDRAYVTNVASNNVSVIDTETNAVIDTVEVGIGPRAVAITPDGSRAYVTIWGAFPGFPSIISHVAVLDTSTNTLVDTVEGVGRGPNWVTIP